MYTLNELPPQLPADLVTLLSGVETATVGHFRHWGFMDPGIRALYPDRRVVGTAVTLAIPAQDSTLLHHLLGLVRPGDFLVIDRLGDSRHACWGGGVTVAARAAGVVGGVIDGPHTDTREILAADMPLWSRGASPITTRIYNLGGACNVPVSCGGVSVNPGDAVLADENGVLILPATEAEAVAREALAKQQRGSEMEQRVASGEKLGEISGASAMVLQALQGG